MLTTETHSKRNSIVPGFDRDVGDKNAQAWQDEQVTVFDCQERLRGYSFVSVVDLDEFLLPLRDENLKEMMVRRFIF